MAVTLDSTGTEQAKAANTSYSYTGLTIGTGLSNSAAVFCIVQGFSATQASAPTFSSVTWNSVACTQICQGFLANSLGCVTWFGIVNPASGNNTFAATSSISGEAYIYGCSFQGVNQTGGTTTFAHATTAANGSSTSLAVTITTASGNYTLCAGAIGTGNTTSTMQLSGVATQDWFDNSDPSGDGTFGAAGKASSSGASAAWTVHNSSLDLAIGAGFDLVASTGSTTPFGGWFFEPPEITQVTEAIGY